MNILRPRAHTHLVSIALLVIRVVFGFAFAGHGLYMVQHPFDQLSTFGVDVNGTAQYIDFAAHCELLGGIGWILGILTPLASACITLTCFAFFLMFFAMNSFMDTTPPFHLTHYAANLSILLLAIGMVIIGPGAYSLDAWLFKTRGTSKKTEAIYFY